jgi:predicted TIM-barrel fold metal-dependent hydrolase
MVFDDVQGEVCYGFHYWLDQPDREVVADMCRVYNDWVLDFFKDTVDRSIAPAMLPSWDIDLSIAEAQRVVGKLGARGVSVGVPYVGEHEGGYCNPAYDRLWAVVSELGVPLANHIGTGGSFGRLPQQPGFILKEFVMCQSDAAEITMDFVSAGVFDRFPTLKVALVEGGVGWAPWYMLVMDRMWHDNGSFLRPTLKKPPSEYFRENILITFQEDPPGIRNLEVLDDCIAWGSDYPHMEGTFPHSRESIQKHMGDLPVETQRKLCAENAARFFGFDLDHIVKKYGPGSEYQKRYSQGDGGSIRVKD